MAGFDVSFQVGLSEEHLELVHCFLPFFLHRPFKSQIPELLIEGTNGILKGSKRAGAGLRGLLNKQLPEAHLMACPLRLHCGQPDSVYTLNHIPILREKAHAYFRAWSQDLLR